LLPQNRLMTNEPIETLWEGRHLRVQRRGPWEYVERIKAAGGVVIVAETDAGELLLIEQYRVPLGRAVIELPAGLVGDEEYAGAEDWIAAARRELLEETGFEADAFEVLTGGPTSAGLTNEINVLVRATGLRRVASGGGGGHEQIQLHTVALARIDEWLAGKAREGREIDPKVFAGLYFVFRAGSARYTAVPDRLTT